jgi:molybdate transport system substrate-binding protein
MVRMKRLLALAIALMLALPAHAAPLLVAAASDLAYCIDALAAAFAAQSPGAQVKVTTGASGNFFAQIEHGAPYDVFMSADTDYPAGLAKAGAADGATLTPYATGRLALWTLDPKLDLSAGLAVLRDPRVTRFAIANPATAPYGRAARAALERDRLWRAVMPKLVLGENIAQTVQFIQSGNAQLGIVSLAALSSPQLAGLGHHVLLPQAGLAPIAQAAIVTTHGRANPLAGSFVRFLASPAAQAIFARHGFASPQQGGQ